MRQKLAIIMIFLGAILSAESQILTQVVKGRIVEQGSNFPLEGVAVTVEINDSIQGGTTTSAAGYFRIENVPIGRVDIVARYIGYTPGVVSNVQVTSAKEVILNLKLVEVPLELSQVVVEGRDKTETVNDMIAVSGRTFDAFDTEKYAATRQDPARMVANFAGVQGTDDGRNDIVVKGNSPLGVLWQYEDVEIPNPSHFAVAGTTGGSISILNNKVIDRSDFITSAFPANYGNAISAVFDVKMRPGNAEKHEFTGQFGLWGTELMAEGPLAKSTRASYIAAYRYSTFQILDGINFNLGTNALPIYQDGAFKLNFPTKKMGVISVWGIGGWSSIDIIVSEFEGLEGLKILEKEAYGIRNRDQSFTTGMFNVGASWAYPISKKMFSKLILAFSGQQIKSNHKLVLRDSLFKVTGFQDKQAYNMISNRTTLKYFLNYEFDTKNTLETGITADLIRYNFVDSIFNENANPTTWTKRLDHNTTTLMLQPYAQWKHRFSLKLDFMLGLHGQYFRLSNAFVAEPRLGLNWKVNNRMNLSFGYGLHSRMLPDYIYFANADGGTTSYNSQLNFIRAHHLTTTYNFNIKKNLRLRTEVYYQHLFDIPVEVKTSDYSVVNQGSGFDRFFPDTLTNRGTGYNYGFEFTLEKFFSKNYYLLMTASLFDSKYRGSDDVLRNTDYNGNFILNVLGGYEKNIGKKKHTTLITGARITWGGGRRYSPIDEKQSLAQAERIDLVGKRNTLQFENYFRLDLKLGFRFNRKKITHEFSLDLFNATDYINYLRIVYDPNIAVAQPSRNPLQRQRQLGRLPMFYYKIDF